MAESLAFDAGKAVAGHAAARIRRILCSHEADIFLAEILLAAEDVLQGIESFEQPLAPKLNRAANRAPISNPDYLALRRRSHLKILNTQPEEVAQATHR